MVVPKGSVPSLNEALRASQAGTQRIAAAAQEAEDAFSAIQRLAEEIAKRHGG